MKSLSAALFPTLFLCLPLHADVTPYPDPPNAVPSPVFSLTVDDTPVTVMKYMDYHYAHFAFDGTVSVKVTAPETIANHTILPASLALQGQTDGGSGLTFSMKQVAGTDGTPRYLVVQVNALEKLVLLGDPPERDVPPPSGPGIFNVVTDHGADKTGESYTQPALQAAIDSASSYGTSSKPGIVYVPPGLYKIRANLLLKDNVDLYLAPGSVLKADDNIANYPSSGSTLPPVLTVDNAENVTIRGRGEVDASGITLMNLLSRTPPVFVPQSPQHPRRRIIRTNNGGTSGNVTIDGVLCKDASGWSVELKRTLGVAAQNVKVLNHTDIRWKVENDGINVCSSSDARVNQCFVMTIDDATCSKATDAVMGSMDDVRFSNNVLWTWAAGVKAGMQNDHPMNGVVFRNIDVVHCRRAIGLDTKTSQDIGQTIPIEGVLFDDIRVDGMSGHWNISNHDAVEFLLEDAPVHDITIRNLRLPANRPIRCGPNHAATNIKFVNLSMNSETITDLSQVTVVGNRPIHDLTFEVAAPATSLAAPPAYGAGRLEITAIFSEPVTGLEAGDFVVTNATISALTGGPEVFTLELIPSAPQWVSVYLPAGVAHGAASSGNLPSNPLHIPRAARSTPFPEVESGALFLHLSAEDLALADGDPVTGWADRVNGRALSGTATFAANYTNGHPGVRFNGTSDILGITDLPNAPNAGQATLFIVGNFTTTGNDAVSDFMVSGQYPTGAANNRFRIFKRGNDGRIDARAGGGSTIAGAVTDTAIHVFGLISGQTAGAVDLVMDGRILGSGSSGAGVPLEALFLGGYGNGTNQFFDGTVAEVLLFDGGLSPADSAAVQDYLTRKYLGHALDSDLDGLPDVWEIDFFGDVGSSSGGSSDTDGDSSIDVAEWLAGTDPTDPRSFFAAELERPVEASMGIRFEAAPARHYLLESSLDLIDWNPAGSVGPLPTGGWQTIPLGPVLDPTRFFRVRVSWD